MRAKPPSRESLVIDPRSPEERRQFLRLGIQFPITLIHDGVIMGKGTVYDLSGEGCAVERQVNVRTGEHVALQLSLPDQPAPSAPLKVEVAAVRWTSQRKFGLEFIRMPGEDQTRLRRYVTILRTTSH